MKAKFVGAVDGVTGSCTWLKHNDVDFLVDCGMVQGANEDYYNNRKFPFVPKKIKFVILTHSHIDHCGLLPRLCREGFVGKVYCTSATARMAKEILLDAAKLGAPYGYNDVKAIRYECLDERNDFNWGYFQPVDNDIFVSMFRSAHILGSVSVGISWDKSRSDRNILFTGDIGMNTEGSCNLPLLRHRQGPHIDTRYIVSESTYGARETDHECTKLESRINNLESVIIDHLFSKTGQVIIPTFSQHRTQEILFDLNYLLKIKWRGGIPESKKEISLLSYLKREYRLFNGLWSLKKESYDEMIKDKNIPDEFKEQFTRYYEKFVYVNDYDIADFMENKLLEKVKFNKVEKGTKKIRVFYEVVEDVAEAVRIFNTIGMKYKIAYNQKADESVIENDIIFNRKVKIEPFPVKVIVNSPLSNTISNIYAEELFKDFYSSRVDKKKKRYLNSNISTWLDTDDSKAQKELEDLYTKKTIKIGVHQITKEDNPKNIKNNDRCIIITSAGMCNGGVVLAHLNKLTTEGNTFVLNGFQSKNTNGYILDHINEFSLEKKKTLKIKHNEGEFSCSDIKAEILHIGGYSGHADQKSLLDYLFVQRETKPNLDTVVFLNHGDDEAKKVFSEKIKETNILLKNGNENYTTINEVIIPDEHNGWFDLNENRWLENDIETEVQSGSEINSAVLQYLKELAISVNEIKQEVSAIKKKL
ncbi:MAG: MBL fold metallo-hydrolase [Spirochaetes bacterium]|nr:MBL fold metallo-hydrolase [Spirochaetota bacterium]